MHPVRRVTRLDLAKAYNVAILSFALAIPLMGQNQLDSLVISRQAWVILTSISAFLRSTHRHFRISVARATRGLVREVVSILIGSLDAWEALIRIAIVNFEDPPVLAELLADLTPTIEIVLAFAAICGFYDMQERFLRVMIEMVAQFPVVEILRRIEALYDMQAGAESANDRGLFTSFISSLGADEVREGVMRQRTSSQDAFVRCFYAPCNGDWATDRHRRSRAGARCMTSS